MNNLLLRRYKALEVASRLPAAYQEVEWIGTTSQGPYLRIGNRFTFATDRLECEMQVPTAPFVSNSKWLGSVDKTGCNLKLNVNAVFNPNPTGAMLYYGPNTYNIGSITPLKLGYDVWAKLIIDNASVRVGDSVIKTVTPPNGTTDDLYLFAGGFDNFALSIYRIKSYCVYSDNVLTCDLVPCYRKTDSVIGMYDTVAKMFYTNVGTGEFVKGEDIH